MNEKNNVAIDITSKLDPQGFEDAEKRLTSLGSRNTTVAAQTRQMASAADAQKVSLRGSVDATAELDEELTGFLSTADKSYRALRLLDTGQDLLARSLRAGLLTQKQHDDLLARITLKYAPIATGAIEAGKAHGFLAGKTDDLARSMKAIGGNLARGNEGEAAGNVATLATRLFNIGPAGIAAAVGIGATVGALALLIAHAERGDRVLLGVQGRFAGSGRGDMLGRDGVKALIDQVNLLPGMSREAAQQSVAALAMVPTLAGPMFRDLAALVADYARATGKEAPAAAQELARAFESPLEGAKALDRQLNLLTGDQLLQIQTLERQGRVMEAQKVLYDALQSRTKGLAEQGLTQMQKRTDALGNAWDKFKTSLAESGPVDVAKSAITGLLSKMTLLFGVLEGYEKFMNDLGMGSPNDKPKGAAPSGPSWDQRQLAYNADLDAQIKRGLAAGSGFQGKAGQMANLRDTAAQLRGSMVAAAIRGETAAYKELQRALGGVNDEMARLGKDSHLAELQNRLAALKGPTTEVEKVTRDLAQSREHLTKAQIDARLAVAKEIDGVQRLQKETKAYLVTMEALAQVEIEMGAYRAQQDQRFMGMSAGLREQLGRGKIGLIQDPVARAQAQAKFDLEQRGQGIWDQSFDPQKRDALLAQSNALYVQRTEQLAEDLKPAYRKMLDAWQDNNRLMRDSFDSLQLSVIQAGENMAVEFGRTGKLSAESLLGAFRDEIIRSQYRKYFAPGLSNFTDWLGNKVFGSGSSSGVGAAGVDSGNVSGFIGASVNHTGRGPGDPLGRPRFVHPAYFENAPRFHGGIGPGERAAVITNEESVLTRGQMRALGQRAPNVTVQVINQSSSPVEATQSGAPKFDGEGFVVGIVLRDMARGGPIREAVKRAAGPVD